MTLENDPHSTSKRMRMTLACERCRLKKVKCDFAHPICGRCRGAKAACSYTGAPTQIDLFNLVQLNETVSQLQSRVAAIESGVEGIKDDTRFIAKEIRNKRLKTKHEFATTATAPSCNYDAEVPSSSIPLATSSSSSSSSPPPSSPVQQQQLNPNWAVSLTPNGLRVDTNIISLNDLYDILLSGLSQLRTIATTTSTPKHSNPTSHAGLPHPATYSNAQTATTDAEAPGGIKRHHGHDHHHESPQQHHREEDNDEDDEEDGLNAVVIKYNPLYRSKDIIFPLYSAWESGNSNHEVCATTSRTSTSCCIARKLPHPALLNQLLKIYEECFLCLPLPEMDTFLQQCKEQTASPLLINAVLSWSARHAAIYHGILGQQDPNRVGEPYFAAAKALLRDAFLTPRVETVHALLLMYIYSIGKTGPDRCESEAYTFLGLATRMAFDLGLHRAHPEDETGRRLFAALEFLETLCAAHSDKPMLFPLQAQTIQLLDHEQGERRYRAEFTKHRHMINQIYRRIHTSCHQSDPLFKTVSTLERELKTWYKQLPCYFQYNPHQQKSWTSTSFREQACLKLNFEYHFQMCQLYSIFLPPHPDKQHTVNLLSLRLCLNSADAITELLECWMQLRQPWCHFTLDTIVMACLVYGHQFKSKKPEVLAHAKRQMQRVGAVLKSSPVKHHKYVRTLIARIEKQTNPSLSPHDPDDDDDEEQEQEDASSAPAPSLSSTSSSSTSSIWQEQTPLHPSSSPFPPTSGAAVTATITDTAAHVSTAPPPPMAVLPSAPTASLEEDWSWLKPTDIAVNDLFRFADFIYTPTMDMMGYQWPPS
ncbi:hypothetical protein BDB00DRAFT_821723 [Zychaea mexicana]|uniref:uncharacterized protein n=1 Tax=Zychaea mexicana TaxID=64656 RepID=UPI0022FE07FF|nr:uncharacterized protein BDB00DRAFT_821723 [Zychaea mexicana]KAI9493820.1 hypothetical protein BDB00DRAFT_821723 [Zychaea mexicana]